MNKKVVGVIFGGNSPEYSVSLQSAHSIISNIDNDKYEVILIGITKDGDWYRYYGDVDSIKEDTWHKLECNKTMVSLNPSDHGILEFIDSEIKTVKIDVVFPVLHGKNGEDGTVQGLLELSGIPYVGCGVLSSAVCMDKYISHELVLQKGIKAAKSILLCDYENVEEYKEQIERLGFPLFVKPLRAGSSYGISRINSMDELNEALDNAFQYDTKVILEENIDGIEVGCSVFGNKELTVGVVDEIILSSGFFDFEDKYENRTSEIICPAKSMSEEKKEEIKEIAKKIYRILDCKGFARVDMFLTSNGDIYLNEVNTIPGFTVHSRYPAMLNHIGMSFSDIVNGLIELELN